MSKSKIGLFRSYIKGNEQKQELYFSGATQRGNMRKREGKQEELGEIAQGAEEEEPRS